MKRPSHSSLGALAIVGAVVGCGSSSSSSSHDGSIVLKTSIAQALSVADVTRVTVKVTGPNITTAITDQLTDVNGAWGGILGDIPSGADHVHGDAYDANGNILYSGDADVTVLDNIQSEVLLVLEGTTTPAPFTNSAPIIDSVVASTDNVAPGGNVHLTVTAHDPDQGDVLTYAWSDAAAPQFSAATATSTDWTAPATTGLQTITVTVTDHAGASSSASVTVLVSSTPPPSSSVGSAAIVASFNGAPTVTSVSATPTRLDVGDATTLSAVATDPDAGDTLTYGWTTTCAGTLANGTTTTPTFTLSALDPSGTCSFTVTATDTHGASDTGTFVIQTAPAVVADRPAVIDNMFQSTGSVAVGDAVLFRVSAHDPTGAALTYAWTATSGSPADFTGQTDTATSTEVTWNVSECVATTDITLTITSARGATTTRDFTVSCP